MPLYDYACDQCGHRFEVRQGIKEDPLTECPQCGGPIRRVIHPVGIVFKGSGFYITDSRNKSSATSPARASESTGDKKESSTTGGAESKPAATETSASSSTSAPSSKAAGE